jgi:hypothetical protein
MIILMKGLRPLNPLLITNFVANCVLLQGEEEIIYLEGQCPSKTPLILLQRKES